MSELDTFTVSVAYDTELDGAEGTWYLTQEELESVEAYLIERFGFAKMVH